MNRIPRRRFLPGVSALCISPSAVQAQLPAKAHRIGYIQTATAEEQEQAAKIEFVINRRTARTLGVTVPQEMLLRADRVIDQPEL